MTHDELRALLFTLLGDLLGTYTGGRPALSNLPAGHPTATVRATGLEVVIEQDPEDRGFAVHHHARSHGGAWRVRLVRHGAGSLYEARTRVLEQFPDARATIIAPSLPEIPAQELIEIAF